MAEINFEKSLNQLEGIVQRLESGDLSLEESLKQFEEGMKVTQALAKKLEEASRKVELLLKGPDGRVTRQALEGGGADDAASAPAGGETPKPRKRRGKSGNQEQDTLFE